MHAGGPVAAPPVVDARGRIYVTTRSGHVHAFTREGGYRWSRTLSGAVAGPMTLAEATGRLWVGTTDRRVYAINADGFLEWELPTVSAVMTGLSRRPDGTLVFVGRDGYLYGVSPQGGSLWRIALGVYPSAELSVDERGVAWVPAGRELLRVEGAWRVDRIALGGEVLSPPQRLGGGVLALSGGELFMLNDQGRTLWSRDNVAAMPALASDKLVIVSPEGELGFLDAEGRELSVSSSSLGAGPAAQPASDGRLAYVPLLGGEIAVIQPLRGEVARLVLPSTVVGRLAIDTAGQRLVTAVAGGLICSVPLAD